MPRPSDRCNRRISAQSSTLSTPHYRGEGFIFNFRHRVIVGLPSTADDPTDEISAAWAVKEQLRRLLATSSLDAAHTEKMRLGVYVLAAKMVETDRLWATVCSWWPAIEVLIVTGVTNAKTEAANTSIKQIKRSGRGFRNEHHYRARILLASAARRAA